MGENYILREKMGENVVEGEKAGEWEENEERWEDDEYTLRRHIKCFLKLLALEDDLSHSLHLIHLFPLCIFK